MTGQLFGGACVFGAVSYINFCVLSSSFFTIFIGIAAAFIAAFSLFMAIMVSFSTTETVDKDSDTTVKTDTSDDDQK